MNIRKRTKLAAPVSLIPGDSLQVTYDETDAQGNTTRTVLVEDRFTKAATYDEAFTFDDVIDGRPAIGGGVIEVDKK